MILVLTGPTGSGKSELALSLAKKLGAVIINADAFQVYQKLNIATAKPSEAMRMEVPHYLYDFVPLSSSYNISEYQKDLRALLAELETMGKNAIIAGGTGLYIRSALYDYDFPSGVKVDMSKYQAMSEEEIYAFLTQIDPESAKTIHPHNRIRVERAIEIFLSTGKKKSEIEAMQNHAPMYDVRFYGLQADRVDLYPKVERRVDKMFEMGLLEETKPLAERYGREARAFRAIGVKELFPYFDGFITLDQAKDEIKKNTRNYIRRQLTWFRHQFDLTWVENEEDILKDIA